MLKKSGIKRKPEYCYVVDARLLSHGKLHWEPRGSFPSGHWDEYLDVFGSMRVLARTKYCPTYPHGELVFPASILVGRLPHYIGPLGALACMFSLAKAARSWAKKGDAFIIRSPGFIPMFVWCWVVLYRKPYVVEVLGDPREVFEVVKHPLRQVWKRLYGVAQSKMIQRASRVLYVSEALACRYPPPLKCERIVVSDVKLTDDLFVEPRAHLRPLDCVHLVHVGTMDQDYKGHEYLLRAVAICRAGGLNVRLVLIGEGRLRPHFEGLCKQLGVCEFVEFKGSVVWGEKLFALLDAADIFVLCSLTEGLGKALLEAMARGLPAIGTNVGGIPELLGAAALVPPANEKLLAEKIVEFASDPLLLTRESLRNVGVAKKYRNSVLSTRRLQFYRDFAGSL